MTPFLWVAAIVALLPLPTATQHYTTHKAVYYSAGVMERVVAVRLRQGLITQDELTDIQGYFAAPDCAGIGHKQFIALWNPVGRVWMKPVRMLQVDCSQSVDRKRHEAEHLIEVGYELAVQAHFVGEGKTRAKIWEEK